MILYFIVALFSAILMHAYNKSNKKIYLFLSFFVLFFISAFRFDIGYDYSHIYIKLFDKIISGYEVNWDIGNILIIKFIGLFSKDYLWFFVIMSFFTMFFIYKSFNQFDKIAPILVFLFVCSGEYLASFNAVRQYVAIAIFMYSLKFIKEKNFKKYLLCILGATLLHSSAIFLIPVYFINRIKPTIKCHMLIFALLIISLPFISTLFYQILKLTKYSHYIISAYGNVDPTYSELILFSIIYMFSVFNFKKCKKDEDFDLFFNLTLVGLAISILSFRIILAYRVIFYFKMVTFYTIAIIYRNIPRPKAKLAFISLFILMFSAITLIGAYKLGWYDIEYKNIIIERCLK